MGADITESVPRAPFWGWAGPRPGGALPAGARRVLAERLGLDAGLLAAVPAPPAAGAAEGDAVAAATLPDVRLAGAARVALARAVPTGEVSSTAATRLLHAAGKHTPDLIRQRALQPLGAPDAVVTVGEAAEVADVLRVCVTHDIAVVPFGGGTSVVGGVAPDPGDHAAVIALDLRRLDQLVAVNPVDRTATFGAGVRGPALEAELGAHGFTLGHIPQSHQQATLGGYAATRSAGQASTGYGAIADLVTAVVLETPSGRLTLGGRAPASAAGPDLLKLAVGSEGTLGVITEVTVGIRRAVTAKASGAWAFRSFAAGAAALRALAQDGAAGDLPDVCRLSDEEETELTLAQADGAGARMLRRVLAVRGVTTPALFIGVWEGTGREVRQRKRRARRILRAHGGVSVTAGPARAWDSGRFAAPALRDELLSVDVFVDTLETATAWSRLGDTHAAVRSAIRGALTQAAPDASLAARPPCAVQGHVSHVYRGGASLYFTFLARAEADPIAQYARVKAAANAAIVAAGATITHHHGVGTEHRALLPDEIGERGVQLLRAVKRELDPTGIMNPGKLV